jgi:hypothetical protein
MLGVCCHNELILWVTFIFQNVYILLEIVLYIQHIELHVMGRFKNSLWPLDISVTFSLVYKFAGTILGCSPEERECLGYLSIDGSY